ncbi:MAG: hypothetical protein ACI8V2_000479 [Candidatus Latescibacterota bacterium]|jgi:hypothetical protein
MSSLNTTMWTYPWDLNDEGYSTVLGKLKNDMGLNAINLASAYHTFDMLRPHLPKNNVLQISQAATYFQPQLDLYNDTCITPPTSTWMGNDNWWGKAAEEAARIDLDLNAWTVFFHNSNLAQQHPTCAIERCTGDKSASALCPANPNVRVYAIALSQDLVQNYGIKMLECESLDYAGWGHSHHHLKHGVPFGQGGQYLYSLCFCTSCQNKAMEANIDITRLREQVTQKIHTLFATGHPIDTSPEELATEIPELTAFNQMRENVVTSLVHEIKNTIQIPLSYILMGNATISGSNPEAIIQIAETVEILSYTQDTQRTHQAISQRLPLLQSPDQLVVGLQAYPPASPNAETLCQNMDTAQKLGISNFAFYNYGVMPMPSSDWVKQAVEQAQNFISTSH